MNRMNESQIEELLSGYLDGELSERTRTEVKRLIRHDDAVAKKFNQMKKQKDLLSALPVIPAPHRMYETIKSSAERKLILNQWSEHPDESKGAKHLMFRHALTVAAMFALVAALAWVIYDVMMPEHYLNKLPIVKKIMDKLPGDTEKARTPSSVMPPVKYATMDQPLNSALRLNTYNFIDVTNFIDKAIYSRGLLEYTIPKRRPEKTTYKISGPPQRVIALIDDIQAIWDKCEIATLTIYGPTMNSGVIIDSVTATQIKTIIDQSLTGNHIQIAKNFAYLNSIAKKMPGKDMHETASAEKHKPSLPLIPVKPILTSPIQPPMPEAEQNKIDLTIIIAPL